MNTTIGGKRTLLICGLAAIGVFALVLKYPPASRSASGVQMPQSGGASQAYLASDALPSIVLLNDKHYYVAQAFDNCGPAALSMDLSFYGVHVSQQTLESILRPSGEKSGRSNNKSTSPNRIATQAQTYGLVAYYRPNGNMSLLKQLVANGFPIITRTLFATSDDFAHYRVVKGYNDLTNQVTEEDGIQGENMRFSYNTFLTLWKPFNYEYIVLAPPDKQAELESILGGDASSTIAWQTAAKDAEQALLSDATDTRAEFNLSVADYYVGDYAGSVQAFEEAEPNLPKHTLWYQIEPIESYYELGDYSKVFSLSQSTLLNNPDYPELYVLEGESYLKEGILSLAKSAFETALKYNKNFESAKEGLASIAN
jgi:tetratricopeptide (TPR) repeat protein